MGVDILEVKNRAALKEWVRFPLEHYKDQPRYVPPLIGDELRYFTAGRNPAFEVCDVCLFLALVDGRTVGRVCGLINELEVEKLGRKVGRFGWFESIDDQAVADALLGTVESWLRSAGCEEMTGPHGFSDLDPGGVLLDGFDQTPTISGTYSRPYYSGLVEAHGLIKDVDYVEFRVAIEDELPFIERLRKRLEGYDAYRAGESSHLSGVRAIVRSRPVDTRSDRVLHQAVLLLPGSGFREAGLHTDR